MIWMFKQWWVALITKNQSINQSLNNDDQQFHQYDQKQTTTSHIKLLNTKKATKYER